MMHGWSGAVDRVISTSQLGEAHHGGNASCTGWQSRTVTS